MDKPQPYLTIRDVCAELRVSRATLYTFLGRELPVTRIGKCVRIARADLDAFTRARRQAPAGHRPEAA